MLLNASIRNRLAVYFVAFALIPAVFIELSLFKTSEDTLERSIMRSLEKSALQTVDKIDRSLHYTIEDVRSWAALEVMQQAGDGDSKGGLSQFLKTEKFEYGVFAAIHYINPAGQIVASSEQNAIGTEIENKSWVHDVFESGKIVVDDLLYDAGDQGFSMKLNVPVFDKSNAGEIIGILSARFNWSELNLITNSVAFGEQQQSEHSYVVLLNRLGLVLAGPDFVFEDEPTDDVVSSINYFEIGLPSYSQHPDKASVAIEVNLDGTDVLAGIAHYQGFRNFGDLDWTVVVVEDRSTALMPVQDLRKKFLFVLAIIILVSLLGAYLISRGFTKPIAELVNATRLIGLGDFGTRMNISSRDEIGTLAAEFDNMSVNLHAQQAKRAEAEAKLIAAKDSAEQANAAKSQFLANMSHELRTPLNAIIGYGEMLVEDAAEKRDEDSERDLQKILWAGRHLLGLINDILDLSKIEAGKIELFVERFSIESLVNDVQEVIAPLIRKNGNRLDIEFAADIGELETDRTRLQQILFNLLSNAAKFTKDGDVTLEISCHRESDGHEEFVFTVRDTGIGMSEAELSRLFQPFVQGDPSTTRKYGGTGLGLVISSRLCALLHGEISVESTPGQGSIFTLRLPSGTMSKTLDLSASGRFVISDMATADDSERGENAGLVLIIDDDAEARELLTSYVSKLNYRVATAADGKEGIRLARELRPSAVILDVIMPGIDGWSVLEVMKADPEISDIPVVMCTITDSKQRAYTLGASDYLMKPVDRSQLKASLATYYQNPTCKLLVVEDDDASRELMVRNAESFGWNVVAAANGKEALQRIAEQRPDLIMLDLMMPELDGFGVIDALQTDPAWRDIPVIVVSAKELSDAEHNRLNNYVDIVLGKCEYSEDKLVAEIAYQLNAAAKRLSL